MIMCKNNNQRLCQRTKELKINENPAHQMLLHSFLSLRFGPVFLMLVGSKCLTVHGKHFIPFIITNNS